MIKMMTKPPKAVQQYMAEFEETEVGMRDYILRQVGYYREMPDKAKSTVEQWIGFKLGCSSAAARMAIKWAEGQA